MKLTEDKFDMSKMYFHGSKSVRKSDINAPSTRYPFYITRDLHYSMAFATKPHSSVGGNRAIKYDDTGYVYVIAVNPQAELFDFRKDAQSGYPVMRKVFPGSFVDLVVKKYSDASDIYMFGSWALNYLYPIVIDMNLHQTSPEFQTHYKQLCDFYFKEDLDRYLDENGEVHQLLEFIFDKLKDFGYDGVITSETDNFNGKSISVSTDYAVGLWNTSGFSISGAPLKYRFCKKINPKFINNETDISALEKAEKYIQTYKRLFQKKN